MQNLHRAEDAIRTLTGASPPIAAQGMSGGTSLTARWALSTFSGVLPSLSEHVISAVWSGSGRLRFCAGSQVSESSLDAGTISVLPRGRESQWQLEGQAEVSSIYLGHQRLMHVAEGLAPGQSFELFDRVRYEDHALFGILHVIDQAIADDPHGPTLFIEHAIDLACIRLLQEHSSLRPSTAPQRGLARWQVKRVMTYMKENLSADLHLQDLADVVSMSRFHFCSAFKLATGSSPHDYLLRLRVIRACELLRGSNLPISDISLSVGYRTPSAFTAAFRRVEGKTPRQFRMQL